MVCHFCGGALDETTVNSLCTFNSNDIPNDKKGKFTSSTVSLEYLNTKRHYFAKPSSDFHIKYTNKENEIKLNSQLVEEKTSSLHLNRSLNRINELNDEEIKSIMMKMKKISMKNGFDLENTLLKKFNEKDGLTEDMIKVFLEAKFDLEDIEINKLLNFFTENNKINLGSLISFIRNNSTNPEINKYQNPFDNNLVNENSKNSFSLSKNTSPRNRRYNDDSIRSNLYINY
jgi:hypothetical protein